MDDCQDQWRSCGSARKPVSISLARCVVTALGFFTKASTPVSTKESFLRDQAIKVRTHTTKACSTPAHSTHVDARSFVKRRVCTAVFAHGIGLVSLWSPERMPACTSQTLMTTEPTAATVHQFPTSLRCCPPKTTSRLPRAVTHDHALKITSRSAFFCCVFLHSYVDPTPGE